MGDFLGISEQYALVWQDAVNEFWRVFGYTALVAAIVLWAVYFLIKMYPAMCKAWDFWGLKSWASVPVFAAFCGICFYGATKEGGGGTDITSTTGADADIAVGFVEATLTNVVSEVDGQTVTNTYTDIVVGFTSGNVTQNTPFLARNADTEAWTELVKTNVSFYLDEPVTNYMFFTVHGNIISDYRMYWLGDDAPAVEVTVEGVDLNHVVITATSIELGWQCSDTNCTSFVVRRRLVNRDGTRGAWQEIVTTDLKLWRWDGVFTIGESWEYQVKSEY